MEQKNKTSKRKRTPGRPSREQLGLEPTVQITLKVEASVIAVLKERHGSISQALRVAAGK